MPPAANNIITIAKEGISDDYKLTKAIRYITNQIQNKKLNPSPNLIKNTWHIDASQKDGRKHSGDNVSPTPLRHKAQEPMIRLR